MKPIIQQEKQDTILTKDITSYHIVVAIMDGKPCILAKDYNLSDEELSFLIINDGITRGNGFDFSKDECTPQLMVEYALKFKTKQIAVFKEKDWKLALQWLIDNAIN